MLWGFLLWAAGGLVAPESVQGRRARLLPAAAAWRMAASCPLPASPDAPLFRLLPMRHATPVPKHLPAGFWHIIECFNGGCSSVGRVQDCDSCCRGFEPHQPPQTRKSPVQKCTGDFCFGRKLFLPRAESRRDIRMANRAAAGLRPRMLRWIFRRLVRGLPDFGTCRIATVAMPYPLRGPSRRACVRGRRAGLAGWGVALCAGFYKTSPIFVP